MKEKRTLSIDKETISRSKKYAKAYNKSLSSLVENYLETLSDSDHEDDWKPKQGSVVEKLSGAVLWPYGDKIHYNDVLEEELLKKPGLQ